VRKALCVLFVVVVLSLVTGCDVVVGDISTTAETTVDAVVTGIEDGVEAAVSDATGQVCEALGDETCEFIGIK